MTQIYSNSDFQLYLPYYLAGIDFGENSTLKVTLFTINRDNCFSYTISANPCPVYINVEAKNLSLMESGVLRCLLTLSQPNEDFSDGYNDKTSIITTDFFYNRPNNSGQFDNYYTKSETQQIIDELEATIAAEYPDSVEVETIISDNLSDYYNKSEADNRFVQIENPTGDVLVFENDKLIQDRTFYGNSMLVSILYDGHWHNEPETPDWSQPIIANRISEIRTSSGTLHYTQLNNSSEHLIEFYGTDTDSLTLTFVVEEVTYTPIPGQNIGSDYEPDPSQITTETKTGTFTINLVNNLNDYYNKQQINQILYNSLYVTKLNEHDTDGSWSYDLEELPRVKQNYEAGKTIVVRLNYYNGKVQYVMPQIVNDTTNNIFKLTLYYLEDEITVRRIIWEKNPNGTSTITLKKELAKETGDENIDFIAKSLTTKSLSINPWKIYADENDSQILKFRNITSGRTISVPHINGTLALTTDFYSNTQIDNLLTNKADKSQLANYYTKTEVDDLLEAGGTANNLVTLTQAQYDNLETVEADTYYFIVEE